MKLFEFLRRSLEVPRCLLERLRRLIDRACETTADVRKASNGCSTSVGGERVSHTVKILRCIVDPLIKSTPRRNYTSKRL